MLTGLRLWVLPARRQRYALDVELDLYQSFEADEPEGLRLRPPLWSGIAESECFGPHRSQARLAGLHGRGSAAIAAFRATAPARPQALRIRHHPELDEVCAVLERDPRGVARRARLREEGRWGRACCSAAGAGPGRARGSARTTWSGSR